MKFFYLLSFFVFFSLCGFCQSNFKQGYIVKLTGDTVKGYIDYKQWSKNPVSVNFKNNENDPTTTDLTVKDIKAFGVNGFEYYENHTVSISQDATELDKIKSTIEPKMMTTAVFLKILIVGKPLKLFNYNDEIKNRIYISEEDNVPFELIYQALFNSEASAIHYNYRFRIQLQTLLQKYRADDKTALNISRANYSESDIVKIVEVINGTKNNHFVAKSLDGIRWFTGVAVVYNSLKFNGNITLAHAPAKTTFSPKVSAGIDILNNKQVQSFFMRIEVDFDIASYDYHDFASTNGIGSNAIDNLKFKQYNFSFSPQLVYNFYNSDNLKIFVDGGINVTYAAYSKHAFIEESNGIFTSTREDYPEFKNFVPVLVFNAGVSINKRLEVYAGYFTPHTISDAGADGRVSSVQAGVNFLF